MQTLFDVPILLIMFNRPAHALRVFERIRETRPASLYIAVDGPRSSQPAEAELVNQCRELANQVDWPCQVQTLFRTENLGCKRGVSEAITWFFENVPDGIILEDDCLPDTTFFSYCQVLLQKYESDAKVMHISGCNLYGDIKWNQYDYFFTNIPHIWGWATWRRAWKNYDSSIYTYHEFEKSGGIEKAVPDRLSQPFWKKGFEEVYANKMDTWDYQWVFAIWYYGGYCITPNQNLISNIGFDQAATHTLGDSALANMPTIPIAAQSMRFPPQIELNKDAMNYAFAHIYRLPSWWRGKVGALKKRLAKYKFSANFIKHSKV